MYEMRLGSISRLTLAAEGAARYRQQAFALGAPGEGRGRQLEQGVMLGQSHVLFLFHPPLFGGVRGWVTDPMSVLLSFK